MPNVLSEFSQKPHLKKKHALFIHSIAMLQNKLAFCTDYPTHEQYNWTSIHTTWTLLKIYLQVPELIYQLTQNVLTTKIKCGIQLKFKQSIKYFSWKHTPSFICLNSSAKRQNAIWTTSISFGNSIKSYLLGVNMLLSLCWRTRFIHSFNSIAFLLVLDQI